MAKKAYVVLKLKDEFTKPLFKAQKGTKKCSLHNSRSRA